MEETERRGGGENERGREGRGRGGKRDSTPLDLWTFFSLPYLTLSTFPLLCFYTPLTLHILTKVEVEGWGCGYCHSYFTAVPCPLPTPPPAPPSVLDGHLRILPLPSLPPKMLVMGVISLVVVWGEGEAAVWGWKGRGWG